MPFFSQSPKRVGSRPSGSSRCSAGRGVGAGSVDQCAGRVKPAGRVVARLISFFIAPACPSPRQAQLPKKGTTRDRLADGTVLPNPSKLNFPASTRRAALRLIDAVLRRSDPLDQAAPPVLRAIERGDDRALALAIAAEALRWLTDLDRLIDGATRRFSRRCQGAQRAAADAGAGAAACVCATP